MKPVLNIIKIGGNVLDDSALLQGFLTDISHTGGPKILVHGGGKLATELSKKLGIEPKMLNGRRITDAATLDVVCMVYAGLINKQLVAGLQALHCQAIGLTGADADIIPANKRPVAEVDYGFVGDIDIKRVNTAVLIKLLHDGYVPVIAPITHDGAGQLLNTNADTIASSLAVALAADLEVNLVYCFEKKGVLQNAEDETSYIRQITYSNYLELKETGTISGGMIPKMDNAYAALQMGVKNVWIGHAENINQILNLEQDAASRLSL